MVEKKLLIASIIGIHGISGFVKVKSFSQAVDGLESYKQLYDKNDNVYCIASCKTGTKNLLIKFAHIKDRSEAKKLKGVELFIKASQLLPLAEEEFYHKDLIGLTVKDSSTDYGKIIAVHNFGAGDLLEIKKNTEKSFFVPFKKEFMPIINIKEKYVILASEALNIIDM